MDAPPISVTNVAAAAVSAVVLASANTVVSSTTVIADHDDEPMDLPPTDRALTTPIDKRPTMAALLREQETIRRDEAKVEANKSRIETPKPLACDIESIERHYAAGRGWSFIASQMDQARPYALPRARYDMVIDTGRTFAKTPLQKIMASLAGSHHGNDALEKLYSEHAIGQVSKLPGGNLRVNIKTKEVCLKLERTKVNILGGVFLFKEGDVLAGKYFLDISNVDSDTNTDAILHWLFILGCKPIYDTFREVNMATGITSATWRVYFLSNTCPLQLMVSGSVCDQILFDHKLHPAHGKSAPFQSERLPYGYRSLHGIDLLTSDEVFPRPDPPAESPSSSSQTSKQPKEQQQAMPTIPTQAAMNGKRMTPLQKAVEESKKRNGKLQSRAPHGSPPGTNQLAKIPITQDDVLSIFTFEGSNGKISPPGSPNGKTKAPLLLLMNGSSSDIFSTVQNKKRRRRSDIDFTALLTKQQPQPLDGIATANYFEALQSMEVDLVVKNATANKKHGVRKQVVPTNVKRPEAVMTAAESAFFVEKHHTKIKKAANASPILEVTESMINEENTALLNLLPDRLAEADAKVPSMVKLIENATNPDHIVKSAAACPLAFNSALSLAMDGDDKPIEELAQRHAINRVLCATYPDEDTTFVTKWKRVMGMSMLPKRQDIFKGCAKWWTHTDAITELSRASKALGMFELALLSIAPTLFKNDH